MGAMEDLLAPSPDDSVEAAYDVCMQKAATALIQFNDFITASAASTLPESSVATSEAPSGILETPMLTRAPTTYVLRGNRCVRGYERVGEKRFQSLRTVTVPMPTLEHL